MFIDWCWRTASAYKGNVLRSGKSGFTINQGVVERGFTVIAKVTKWLEASSHPYTINCINTTFYPPVLAILKLS